MQPDARTANNLRILMLEDLELDAELCREELKRGGLDCAVRRVDTKDAFERALTDFAPTVILSDFSMPRFDGMSALDIARDRTPATPFIFVSGTIGEERAVEAMKRGATDYVLKHRMERLVPVVKRALREQGERDAHRKTGRALEETRARLDGILASLTDAVWSIALSPTEVSYANAATESVYGRPLDQLAGPGLVLDAVHPDDRDRVMAAWAQAAKGGALDVEHRVYTPEGDVRWVHVRARGVLDAEGRVVRIDGISRNITRRRTAEERVARLTRVRAVLSGINAAIVRVRDAQQLYQDACHIVVHDGGFGFAWAGAIDADRDHIDPLAYCCPDRPLANVAGVSMAREGGDPPSFIAECARSGRVVLSNALRGDEAAIAGGSDEPRGFRSMAVLPVRRGGRAVAVLALFSAEPDFFGEQETKLLDELSGNLSFALDYMEKAERVDYLAYYDALTTLPNRRLFFDRLEQLAAHARSEKSEFALMVVDLARFRGINETLGSAAADSILVGIAERLRQAASAAGTCARITADRFAMTLHGNVRQDSVTALAVEHVLKSLDAPFEVGGSSVLVQSRTGVAVFPDDGATAETLFANAEAALRNAKQSGARLAFYARDMNARAAEMLGLENELHTALRENQFVLHYQPRVLLKTKRICGFEALIRWQSPTRGLVPPGDFLPLLEDTGLVLEVGRWALQQAALDAAKWHGAGIPMPPVGVNVSAMQLREADFVDHVLNAIASVGGKPSSIELELTETVIMADVTGNARKLAAIRDAGICIAVDDFGTGYSSLAYLARLPVDALKIDRSFVSSMHASPVQMAIVTTVISLARSLGLNAVAEGVESEAEARVLGSLGCDEGQGFLYSRAVPAESVPALVARMGTSERDAAHARTLQRAAQERTVSRLRRLLGR